MTNRPETFDPGDLFGRLVMKNHEDYQRTTNDLLRLFTGQLADREAELSAIRRGINAILNGPYAPSESAIAMAVWPSSEAIAACREPSTYERMDAEGQS